MSYNFLYVFIPAASAQLLPISEMFWEGRMDPLALPAPWLCCSPWWRELVMSQRDESPWAEVGISVVSETGGRRVFLELLLAC